jgi:AcrR family transcriptional regulator
MYNKKDDIVSVATDLINTRGFNGTSLQEIADKVGIHKSTLFHYIKNKKSLLVLVLEQHRKNVISNLQKISSLDVLEPTEKLREAIRNHLNVLLENRTHLNIYFNEMKMLPPKYRKEYVMERKKYEKNFQDIIIEMQNRGYFKGLDPKILTFGIFGMLGSIPKWYKSDGPLSMEQISDIMYKMIVGSGSCNLDTDK